LVVLPDLGDEDSVGVGVVDATLALEAVLRVRPCEGDDEPA
jgi:hypothetical protein